MSKNRIQEVAEGLYAAMKEKDDPEVLQRAFSLLEKEGLLRKDKELVEALVRIADREDGIQQARIYSRHPLTEKEKSEVEKVIQKRTGNGNIILEQHIAEDLLGGIRIEIGDTVIDYSLRSKVQQLQHHLLKN